MNIKITSVIILCSAFALNAMERVVNDPHEMRGRLQVYLTSKAKNRGLLNPGTELSKIALQAAVVGTNPTIIQKANLKDDWALWADYMPNNSALVVSLQSGIGMFDPTTLKLKHTFNQQPSEIKASPNNTEIALSDTGSVYRYDIVQGKIIAKVVELWGDDMQYNNDSSQLLIGSANGVFDTKSNQKVMSWPAGQCDAQWNPADNNFIEIIQGQAINIFDIRAQKYVQTVASPVPVAVGRYTNSGNNIVISAASQFIVCDGQTAAIQAYYDSNGNKSPNNQPFPVPANPTYVDYFFNMVPQPGAQGKDIVVAALNDQARTMVGFDLAQTTPLFDMPNTGPEIVGLSVLSPDGSKMAEIQMQNPQIQLWDISKITTALAARECEIL